MMRLLVVISGASRGLGRAISVAFGERAAAMSDNLDIVLIARSKEGLQATKTEISKHRCVGKRLNVELRVVDLGDLDNLEVRRMEIEKDVSTQLGAADRFIFINNAGSLGHIGPCIDAPSLESMRKAIDLNVTSSLWLTVCFAKLVAQFPSVKSTIVNISSLVAIQAFPTMGIYCSGKAARDSYFAVMAQEHNPSLRFLSYAPGPLETDMVDELRKADNLDSSLKPHFAKQLVDPKASASALVKLIFEDTFENGQHVDYFDLNLSSA